MLSASRDEREERKGKPREEDGEKWLPVQLQDRIVCQCQKGGRSGWGRGPAALAPDETGGLVRALWELLAAARASLPSFCGGAGNVFLLSLEVKKGLFLKATGQGPRMALGLGP